MTYVFSVFFFLEDQNSCKIIKSFKKVFLGEALEGGGGRKYTLVYFFLDKRQKDMIVIFVFLNRIL